MNELIDNVSRILATPMPRRKAMKLFGGALAAAVVAFGGGQSLSAAGCKKNEVGTTCGAGTNAKCCTPGTCCAVKGNVVACCTKAQCTCTNGTCASSTAGVCPSGCTKCNG
jgi:hypothetical protein